VKTRVLLTEDHRDMREVLSRQLQLLGYEVAVATNGIEAVEMALSEHPDIILMDILMPKMDGLSNSGEPGDTANSCLGSYRLGVLR
jgi:CheY-like chemotaxis protein